MSSTVRTKCKAFESCSRWLDVQRQDRVWERKEVGSKLACQSLNVSRPCGRQPMCSVCPVTAVHDCCVTRLSPKKSLQEIQVTHKVFRAKFCLSSAKFVPSHITHHVCSVIDGLLRCSTSTNTTKVFRNTRHVHVRMQARDGSSSPDFKSSWVRCSHTQRK